MPVVKRVFIDAGHGPGNGPAGSFDQGAISGIWSEHEIVSYIASGLEHAFKHNSEIHLLRAPEDTRSRIVQYVNGLYQPGDIFLSLHMNASSNIKARGLEVIVAATAPEVRRREALVLADAAAAFLRIPLRGKPVLLDSETPRGVLSVLRNTRCPAYMIELGFITNKEDRLAVQSRGLCAVAEGIRALADYK